MSRDNVVTSKNVDLSNCDREQIQYPGAILPHGALLTVREPELKIVQASQNTQELFGIRARDLLNKSLNILLPPNQVASLQKRVSEGELVGPPTRVGVVRLIGKEFDVLAH